TSSMSQRCFLTTAGIAFAHSRQRRTPVSIGKSWWMRFAPSGDFLRTSSAWRPMRTASWPQKYGDGATSSAPNATSTDLRSASDGTEHPWRRQRAGPLEVEWCNSRRMTWARRALHRSAAQGSGSPFGGADDGYVVAMMAQELG